MSAAHVSVIVNSVDDARWRLIEPMYATLLPGVQLIRVPDAKSMAEGYNRGLKLATGQYVIFSHDDVELLCHDLPERLERYLGPAGHDIVGVAGASRFCNEIWSGACWPYAFGQVTHPRKPADGPGYLTCIFGAPRPVVGGIMLLDGVWIAARREAAVRIGFDQYTFDGWHHYDLDFSMRAYLAGLRLAVACDFPLIHLSTGTYDDTWRQSSQRFLAKFARYRTPHDAIGSGLFWLALPDKAAVYRFVAQCPHWTLPDPLTIAPATPLPQG